jgi:hypothetical protein
MRECHEINSPIALGAKSPSTRIIHVIVALVAIEDQYCCPLLVMISRAVVGMASIVGICAALSSSKYRRWAGRSSGAGVAIKATAVLVDSARR